MENKAGVLVCGFIAVVIITVVLAITYHSVDRVEKFTRMVESGADPLKVKCALEDPNGNKPTCIMMAAKELKNVEQ